MCYEDVLTEVSDGWGRSTEGRTQGPQHNIICKSDRVKEKTEGGGVWANPGISNSYTKHSTWRNTSGVGSDGRRVSGKGVGSDGRSVSGKGVSHLGTCPACLNKESGLYGAGRQWTPLKVFPEGNSLEAGQ